MQYAIKSAKSLPRAIAILHDFKPYAELRNYQFREYLSSCSRYIDEEEFRRQYKAGELNYRG